MLSLSNSNILLWPPSKNLNFPLHRCINDLQGIPWSCSSFHYAIIFRSCWRSPHDTECCYRWHGNRSWAGWGVSEVLRRVRGSGDHESADIRVLADSGEDHGLITGALWMGTRGLIKVHLHFSTCVLIQLLVNPSSKFHEETTTNCPCC